MMSVTIDPSETRRPASPAPRPSHVNLRLVLLSSLGILGLAGFGVLAFTTLGDLAGPQFTRPSLAKISAASPVTKHSASEWPDLRDGVPALAPSQPKAAAPAPTLAVAAPAKVERLPAAATPPVVQAAVKPPEPPSLPASAPVVQAVEVKIPEKRLEVAATQKPVRLPPIENAAVLPPARPASLIPATRTAAVIAPLSTETTRSRATNGIFTALPPERETTPRKPVATAAAPHAKPAAAKTAAAKPAAAKPAAAKVASAAAPEAMPASAAAEESEQTELFGLKVPSLAPAGRKIAEGVEALGNAVKSLPDHF